MLSCVCEAVHRGALSGSKRKRNHCMTLPGTGIKVIDFKKPEPNLLKILQLQYVKDHSSSYLSLEILIIAE